MATTWSAVLLQHNQINIRRQVGQPLQQRRFGRRQRHQHFGASVGWQQQLLFAGERTERNDFSGVAHAHLHERARFAAGACAERREGGILIGRGGCDAVVPNNTAFRVQV